MTLVTTLAAGPPGLAAPLGRLPVDVPATPDADSARQAAEHELSKPVYSDQPSLVEMILTWLNEHLHPADLIPGLPAWASWAIVITVFITLIGSLLYVLTRVSLARRARRARTGLFDDARDAASLIRAADAAATRGDYATAVVERFRAIIRSLDERGLVEDYPGMTAQEASVLAATALPDLAGAFHQAGNLFDAVRYGEVVSTPEQDDWMRDLASRVDAARAPRPAADAGIPVSAAVVP